MSQAIIQEPQAVAKQKPETSVNDIAKTGGMTCSDRCYALVNLGAKEGERSGQMFLSVPRED